MKEFRSIGYNYWPITLWVFVLYAVTKSPKQHYSTSILFNLWEGDYSFVLDNIYYLIGSMLFIIVISVDVLIVNRIGITKGLYLIPIVLKRKTWREVSYYIEVEEIYNGQYGKSTIEAIWFIGDNNKVCLRFEKSFRKNIDEILEIIDKFETKNNNKLKISNPYFMRKGWTTIKLQETKL